MYNNWDNYISIKCYFFLNFSFIGTKREDPVQNSTMIKIHLCHLIRFANDVIEASDGSLYITVSSTKFAPKAYYLDLVEGEPHGQLLRYDPSSKQVSIVLEGLYFANGVALSKHGDFVVVCESWK